MGQRRSKLQRLDCTSTLSFSLLGLLLLFSSPAQALNVGIQSVNPGGEGVVCFDSLYMFKFNFSKKLLFIYMDIPNVTFNFLFFSLSISEQARV
jgi:hypothetical protein